MNGTLANLTAIVDARVLAGLTMLEAKALMVYMRHADNATGEAYPSVATVADKIGTTNVGRARAAVQGLVSRGLLQRVSQGGGVDRNGRGKPSVYRLAAVDSLAALDKATSDQTRPLSVPLPDADNRDAQRPPSEGVEQGRSASSKGAAQRPLKGAAQRHQRGPLSVPRTPHGTPHRTPQEKERASPAAPSRAGAGELLEHFRYCWNAEHGGDGSLPAFGAKDRKLAVDATNFFRGDLAKAKRAVERYLGIHDDPFIAGHPWHLFASPKQLPRYMADLPAKQNAQQKRFDELNRLFDRKLAGSNGHAAEAP